MKTLDHLRLRAKNFWLTGDDLPTNLFNEMTNAGLDVDAEKRLFEQQEGI